LQRGIPNLPDPAIAEQFVFLISHERSGSHYLTDMLAATGEIHSFDEVCNFNAINPDTSPASFFRFRRGAQTSDPDIALRPGTESNTRLLDTYLQHLATIPKKKKRMLLDIKYGHVHNFEVGWWPSERRPFLGNYLEKAGIKVVHLTRRDSLAAIISGQLADKTHVWHRKEGDADKEMKRTRVPPMKAVHEALSLEREKENFFTWLATNSCIEVEYEDLTASDGARDAIMTRICAFLGVPAPDKFESRYRKVTPPLREVLDNYEDLVKVTHLFGNGRLRFDPR
jgi:LPS sulfotransferase NodH